MASDDIEKTDNVPEEPEVSEELKYMVDSGNADMKSNPNSLGWGLRQQVKLDHWQPENEEYWEVSSFNTLLNRLGNIKYKSITQTQQIIELTIAFYP